jgi:hypothetical protein
VGSNPQAFLKGYVGTLMTDGYSAWRTLEGVTHLGCMTHARRAFDEAYKAHKKPDGRARRALEYFKALYQVETLARGQLPEGQTRADYTYPLRQMHSVPLLNAFKIWLDEQASQVLPESLTGKAISYTRNQWQYLQRYVEEGRYPIDNNLLERDIRPFTTGRKAWLFSDTVAGAKAIRTVSGDDRVHASCDQRRQRQCGIACRRERQAHILAAQPHGESRRLEPLFRDDRSVAADQAIAVVHFEQQRRHLFRGDAVGGYDAELLRHHLHDGRDAGVESKLRRSGHHRAVTDPVSPRPDRVEQGLCGVQIVRRARRNHRQLSGRRDVRAAQYLRRHEPLPRRGVRSRQPAGKAHADRATRDMEQVGTCRKQSSVPEHDRLDGSVIGEHRHDGVSPGGVGKIGGHRRAPRSEPFGLGPVPVPDGNPVAGRQEIVGHTRAR